MVTDNSLSQVKAQHYIPRFYLSGFTDRKNTLWVYEQFRTLRESKPKAEAHRPDYYTHTENGERNETAEKALWAIENRIAPVIRRLANPHRYVLTEESAHLLTIFVALMFARVPAWRGHLDTLAVSIVKERLIKVAANKEEFHKIVQGLENRRGKSYGVNLEELRQHWLTTDLQLGQTSAAFNLGTMFRSAVIIMGILRTSDI